MTNKINKIRSQLKIMLNDIINESSKTEEFMFYVEGIKNMIDNVMLRLEHKQNIQEINNYIEHYLLTVKFAYKTIINDDEANKLISKTTEEIKKFMFKIVDTIGSFNKLN